VVVVGVASVVVSDEVVPVFAVVGDDVNSASVVVSDVTVLVVVVDENIGEL